MVTVLHYLELRFAFGSHNDRSPFPVTIEKLSDVLHCTPRYAKLIIRKLSNMGWIHWQAGRGRGHKSVMTFLADADDILHQEVTNRTQQGQVQEAMELMNKYGGSTAKNRYLDWLSEGMGFTTQAVSERLEDTLRFPAYRIITTLDPGHVYYTLDSHIAGQLFNTLIEHDSDSHNLSPGIAHSWENSKDGREWTFHLKKSILFHHGRELHANDVVFSLDRIRLHPDRFSCSWMFQDIELVEALDHKTVRIRLTKPNYLFLRFLSTVHASVVPEEIVRNNEAEFAKMPVGTGPFQISKLQEGLCVLEAFPAHFRGRPQLDRVEVLMLPEIEPGRLKEPDWTSVMTYYGDASKAHRETMRKREGNWLDVETLFSCSKLLVFNQWKTGPQNHPAFREALHHLIDREQMIADLGGDRIYPAQGFRPAPPKYDEAQPLSRSQIIELLAESGYRGEELRMVNTPYHEPDAVWIRERCRTFGINIVIDVKQSFEMTDEFVQQYDCQLFGNVFSGDEICELEMYLQQNYFLTAFDKQTAAVVQQTAESIFREPGAAARQQKLASLEQLMRRTNSILYLVHKKSNTSFHEWVRGVNINSTGWIDFDKIWFHPRMASGE